MTSIPQQQQTSSNTAAPPSPTTPHQAPVIQQLPQQAASLGSSHNYSSQQQQQPELKAATGHARSHSDGLVNPFDQFEQVPVRAPHLPTLPANSALASTTANDWQANQTSASSALALSPRNYTSTPPPSLTFAAERATPVRVEPFLPELNNRSIGTTVTGEGVDDEYSKGDAQEKSSTVVVGVSEDRGYRSGSNQKSVLISGYLYKQTRNGNWQRRFFEASGKSLTYFKNRKRTKKLAELDLFKVGSILIDPKEPACDKFIIQVKNRPYCLRADSADIAADWVIQLNRVREARYGIGGMNFASGSTEIITNRHRSHGLRAEDQNIQMFEVVDIPSEQLSSGATIRVNYQPTVDFSQDPFEQEMLYTDWKKKGGKLRVIKYKIVKWARKTYITNICFSSKDDVIVPTSTSSESATNSRQPESSDGGDTSVIGSDATAVSHNQGSTTAAADSKPKTSGIHSIFPNLSPKRRETDFIATNDRLDIPEFEMA